MSESSRVKDVTRYSRGKRERCTSPSNQPVHIAPPKPSRVVPSDLSRHKTNKQDSIQDHPVRPRLRKEQNRMQFSDLLLECKIMIMSYLIDKPDFIEGPWAVNKEWNELCRNYHLWSRIPTFGSDGKVSQIAFRFLGLKNQGTEGMCFKVFHRRSGRLFAMKRARVYPTGEGVPYYMLRELAFLQGLKHPHIATVEKISLRESKLFLLFDYMEKSLFDLINPNNDANGGIPLPPTLVKRFMFQMLQGIAFCHQRGVLHRNLKPKHLMIEIPSFDIENRCIHVDEEKKHLPRMLAMPPKDYEESISVPSAPKNVIHRGSVVSPTPLVSSANPPTMLGPTGKKIGKKDASTDDRSSVMNMNVYAKLLEAAEHGLLRISDFALVRSTSVPLRNYTTEVVTLWYRSPEVLMGGQYFAAVDMWSIGCIFAEMILGKPFFPGICEVDQLFQIFQKLGTPNAETWKEFEDLPNYSFQYPRWKERPLKVHIPNFEPSGLDLMKKLLTLSPNRRITAEEALNHPYFDSVRDEKISTSKGEHISQVIPERLPLSATIPVTDRPDIDLIPKPHVHGDFDHGTIDLNTLCWPSSQELSLASSAWKYNREIYDRVANTELTQGGLGDPMHIVRYYHYLKCLESSMYPLQNYIAASTSIKSEGDVGLVNASVVQKDLLPLHRSMLVDWLVEVIDVFDMSVRSVFMAVNYTDRYLALEVVGRKHFQLLGATCLHIASKCEDVSYIGVEDLVVCADRVYEPKDVLELEEKVLNTLDFRICVPTSIDFLNIFLVRFNFTGDQEELCAGLAPKDNNGIFFLSQKTKLLAHYFVELSLQEYFFISKMPSQVAATAILLAVLATNTSDNLTVEDLQPERFLAITGYNFEELKPCMVYLRSSHLEAPFRPKLHVILRRYQRAAMEGVADLEFQQSLSILYPDYNNEKQ